MCKRPCCSSDDGQGPGIAAVALLMALSSLMPRSARSLTASCAPCWTYRSPALIRIVAPHPGDRRRGQSSGLSAAAPRHHERGQAATGLRHAPGRHMLILWWHEQSCLACGGKGTVFGPSALAAGVSHARNASRSSWQGDRMARNPARSHRSNPVFAGSMFDQVHHSAAGVIWRFRTELAPCFIAIGRHVGAGRGRHPHLGVIILAAGYRGHGPALDPAVHHPRGHGACCPGTASSGSATRPGCTPGPGGSHWSCASTPPRSGNGH